MSGTPNFKQSSCLSLLNNLSLQVHSSRPVRMVRFLKHKNQTHSFFFLKKKDKYMVQNTYRPKLVQGFMGSLVQGGVPLSGVSKQPVGWVAGVGDCRQRPIR